MHVLHMNKGEGETSYAKNSQLQKKIISFGSSKIEAAIFNILLEVQPKSLGIADLGCSSGPNSLTVVSHIIHMVHATCHQMGLPMLELRVSLNDLPGNDFNDVFKSLPELYNKMNNDYGVESCYVWGVPGSFYGRLFPTNSLHFVHSSSSIHWLSEVPIGLESWDGTHLIKENVYISKGSPKSVVNAYQEQFHEDFSLFLRSRAKEMVSKGRMVLSFVGRRSPDPCEDEACYRWELLARALMNLALDDGLVEKEKIDLFNMPYYAPSPNEVKHEVENDGSFVVEDVEAFEIEWDDVNLSDLKISSGNKVVKTIRAAVEPMLETYFHLGPEMVEVLFRKYAKIIDDCFTETKFKYTILVVTLTRKD